LCRFGLSSNLWITDLCVVISKLKGLMMKRRSIDKRHYSDAKLVNDYKIIVCEDCEVNNEYFLQDEVIFIM